eukprot:gene10218-11904_t
MSQIEPKYWCHHCKKFIRIENEEELVCPTCASEFIEEVEQPATPVAPPVQQQQPQPHVFMHRAAHPLGGQQRRAGQQVPIQGPNFFANMFPGLVRTGQQQPAAPAAAGQQPQQQQQAGQMPNPFSISFSIPTMQQGGVGVNPQATAAAGGANPPNFADMFSMLFTQEGANRPAGDIDQMLFNFTQSLTQNAGLPMNVLFGGDFQVDGGYAGNPGDYFVGQDWQGLLNQLFNAHQNTSTTSTTSTNTNNNPQPSSWTDMD